MATRLQRLVTRIKWLLLLPTVLVVVCLGCGGQAGADDSDCILDSQCEAGQFCDTTGVCEFPADGNPFGRFCNEAWEAIVVTDGKGTMVCGNYPCQLGRCRSCSEDNQCLSRCSTQEDRAANSGLTARPGRGCVGGVALLSEGSKGD